MYAAVKFLRGKPVRAFAADRIEAAKKLRAQFPKCLSFQTARAGYDVNGELVDTGSDIRWAEYDQRQDSWRV